jgi:alpha-D-xyloside xylohydrolase
VGWRDGIAVEGPTTTVVEAPLGALPLYLKAGTPLPLLRDTIDTLSPTTAPAELVDSFAEDVGRLWLRVTPGPRGETVVYDGTRALQTPTDTSLGLTVDPGSVFVEGVMVEVFGWGAAPPSAVEVGGAPVLVATSLDVLRDAASGWFFDPRAGGTVYVLMPAAGGDMSVRR